MTAITRTSPLREGQQGIIFTVNAVRRTRVLREARLGKLLWRQLHEIRNFSY